MDQITLRWRGEKVPNNPRMGVSAGFPKIQTRLTVCHVPLGRMLGTERERNVKSTQTARINNKIPGCWGWSRFSPRADQLPAVDHARSTALRPQTPRRLARRWRSPGSGALTSPRVGLFPVRARGFGIAERELAGDRLPLASLLSGVWRRPPGRNAVIGVLPLQWDLQPWRDYFFPSFFFSAEAINPIMETQKLYKGI